MSVQVNGEDATFPDASPAVINGRTMVPMRAVPETPGAAADYDGGARTVTATPGDISLTHVIGAGVIRMTGGEKLTTGSNMRMQE